MRRIFKLAALGLALLIAGCATVQIDDAVRRANAQTTSFSQGKLELARSTEQQQARARLTDQLLAEPVSMDAAVQIALANSASLQALLAQSWADLSAAYQAGRIANPLFTFERMRFGDELELGRLLSVGLLDLLTFPQRRAIARTQQEQAQLQLASTVVEQVSRVRAAWVRAVAAQQLLTYAGQVKEVAEAGAELARRMQQAGNFTKLQRAREHAFYADATAQLAAAQHAATAAREELVRALGLDDAQAQRLKLPERLPEIPAQVRAPADIGASAMQQRLDWQIARLQLEAASKRQGLNLVTSLTDVELGGRHDTVFDNATGRRTNRNGFELDVRLPLFDWGDAQRTAFDAQTLVAANRYEAVTRSATSQLRESYSTYRTAYDLARHYRDEIVPLRKTISDENVLRYNGMLIGAFELLADAREQVASVMAAINAQQQFWLADAALSAALIGRPIAAGAPSAAAAATPGNDTQAH
jgi:outer membrane protein TolC